MSPSAVSGSWLAPCSPDAGVAISSLRVAAVLVRRSPEGLRLGEYAVEPLPPAAVTPALNASNVSDRGVVAGALSRAIDRLGVKPKRVALVIPDAVARVSLIRLDRVPAGAADLERFIRWQVRKSVPFRIDDAQVSWMPAAPVGELGREFVVAVARRDIVEEYEQVCGTAGVQAGLVDLATFNLINVVLAAGVPSDDDWMLVHLAGDSATLAILRGPHLMFFRNRGFDAGGSVTDLVHQTAMYYEDRLGGSGFRRVILAGVTGEGYEERRRELESRLGVRVEGIDPFGAVGLRDRLTATPDVLDALASPIGIVVREQVA